MPGGGGIGGSGAVGALAIAMPGGGGIGGSGAVGALAIAMPGGGGIGLSGIELATAKPAQATRMARRMTKRYFCRSRIITAVSLRINFVVLRVTQKM
jgi:hypothetical protein